MDTVATIGLLILIAFQPAQPGKEVGDYLTADGQFKEVLEIKDVQGGFAGFTGLLWKIEKNGDWKLYQVFNQKLTPKGEGKLTNVELKLLARELAKFDLLGLIKAGKVTTNPHLVTIQFGKHKAELALGAGQPLPRPTANLPPSVEQRFGGIALAVQAATARGKKGQEQ